jgi:hypothetical protein
MSVLLPAGGVVTGWAACRWHGAGYFDGLGADGRTPLPVPLAVGGSHDLRDRPTIRVMRDRLDPDETTVVRGMPCAREVRALFDAMRTARDVREAVVSMDMMAAAELTSVSRMRRYCARHRGWNGLPQVVRALDLADEQSMSPNESRMRLIWVIDAGLPPPMVNQPVFDLRWNLLGIADLFDPVAGLVGEYDGAAHRSAGRHRRDVVREDRFRRVGLEYVKAVGADLLDTGRLVERIIATRARAKFLPAGSRLWTTRPPASWYESPIDLMTLDERLEYQQALHEPAPP